MGINRIFKKTIVFLLINAVLAGCLYAYEMKSANLYITKQGSLYNSTSGDQSVDSIAALNCNNACLWIEWYMDSLDSSEVNYVTNQSPSDTGIIRMIDRARTNNLTVTLNLMIIINDGNWRGQISPADRPAWWASYKSYILHHAQLAQQYNVEYIVIGSELTTMESDLTDWTELISDIRAIYSGKVIYSMNYDRALYKGYQAPECAWMNDVDYLGFSSYFPLSHSITPSVDELKAAWTNSAVNGLNTVALLQECSEFFYGKPIMFVECGYRSCDYCTEAPYDGWTQAYRHSNQQCQANALQACMETLRNYDWWAGMMYWTYTVTALSPTDYYWGINGKLAETVMSDLYLYESQEGAPYEVVLSTGKDSEAGIYRATARIKDDQGRTITSSSSDVTFSISGPSTWYDSTSGTQTVTASSGTASINFKLSVEAGTTTITASSNGLQASSIIIYVSSNATCVFVKPNPYRLMQGNNLTFYGSGVPNSTIKIYTLSGKLVNILREDSGNFELAWDGCNQEGIKVIPGLYLYSTKNQTEKNVGRFTVIY